MIDRVSFYLPDKDILVRPQEDYGMLLKTRSVSPAKAKIFRVEMDGADGAVDFTEWAGRVLYETRTVTVELRDMRERRSGVIRELLGRRAELHFSDDPDWYYSGRCDEIEEARQKQRVVDLKMSFTCQPYKLASTPTVIAGTVTTSKAFKLKARRMPVIPVINSTGSASISIDGQSYSLSSGDNVIAAAKLTDAEKTITVTGSVTVKFTWQDGEL